MEDGPYRLRSASDAAWVPSYGYDQRSGGSSRRIADAFRAALRTILPVLALSAALCALYLYMDTPVPFLAQTPERWLNVSHLLLPVAFLTIHLTNRRYGPAYAFAQIVLSFTLLGAVTLFGATVVQRMLPPTILPSVREVAAFGGAFLVAGFLAIVAFDGSRGPRWWTAPLIGSVVAALVYPPIFYPAAYAGTAMPWFNDMAVHAGVLVAGALVTLLPFWLLRRIVQPLPGYGGF